MSAGNFGEGIPLPLTVDLSAVRAGFAQLLTEYQALRAQITGNPLAPGAVGEGGPVSFGTPAELRSGAASGNPSAWREFDVTERDYSGDIAAAPSMRKTAATPWLSEKDTVESQYPWVTERDVVSSSAPTAGAGESAAGGAGVSGYIQGMATRLAILFAVREAFKIAESYVVEQHDMSMAGSDLGLQYQAIQKQNQAVSLVGPMGTALAGSFQSGWYRRNVGQTGSDLLNQSADFANQRQQQTMQAQMSYRQGLNQLATYSTADPVERERIQSRGERQSTLEQADQRRSEREKADEAYLSNERERIKEDLRETLHRHDPQAFITDDLEKSFEAQAYSKTASESRSMTGQRDAEFHKQTDLANSLEASREKEINRLDANRDQVNNLRLEGRTRQLNDEIAHPRNQQFGAIDATLTAGEGEILGFLQESKPELADKARKNLVLSLKSQQQQYLNSFRTESVNSGYGQLGELFSPATAESPAAILQKFGDAQKEAAGYNPAVNKGAAMDLSPDTISTLARQMAEALSSLIAK